MYSKNLWLFLVVAVIMGPVLSMASEHMTVWDGSVTTDTKKTDIAQMVSFENARSEETIAIGEEAPVLPLDREKPSSGSDIPDAETGPRGAPLKEFEPSEKIPADQAVDFPADI